MAPGSGRGCTAPAAPTTLAQLASARWPLAALLQALRRHVRWLRERGQLASLLAVCMPLGLVLLDAWKLQLRQRWQDHKKRSSAKSLRLRAFSDGTVPASDPFSRIPGAVDSFSYAYEVLQRITDSTYGKVFECRSLKHPGHESLVVKIVPQRNHPLLRTTMRGHRLLGKKVSVETGDFWTYMNKLLELRHERVVKYVEFFADNTSFYFVMERCPGQTLLEYLLSKSSWMEAETPCLLRQLLQALDYIHRCRLVHRDVKLENLMVSPGLQLQLLDFGLGCNADSAHGMIGTVGYMAPEVFCSEAYSCVVDVFAAGVVMSILLTGRPPFNPPVAMRYLQDHVQALHRGLDFLEDPWPLVSDRGRDLLEWMLTPDSCARCTAAEALRHRWFCTPSRRASAHEQAPVLWSSSASQLRFLQVMGVWSGCSSKSAISADAAIESLCPIEETEGEEEAWLEDLCCQFVRHMQVSVTLADPLKPDCPLIAISDGFENLSGYQATTLLGHNCRVLNQHRSAEIPPTVREQLREAVSGSGDSKSFVGVLPNSKADGTPFHNLLHMSAIELRGKTFVVGIQMEVQEPDVDLECHTILGHVQKVHTALRHWARTPSGFSNSSSGAFTRSLSAP